MMNCPNIKHSDYIKLINELGPEKSIIAWIRNGENIPTLEQAKNLLNINQESNITSNNAFKTWNLGSLAGTKQTKEIQNKVNETFINEPDSRIAGGESFNQFSNRVINAIKNVIKNADDNTAVLTHNTVFGLIKAWNKAGRPDILDKKFREDYSKMDSEPSAHYNIEGDNGIIHIIRHGETQDNVDGNFRSDDTQLTQNGIDEANQVGQEMSKYNIPEIISSPLGRAIHTSEIIMNRQGELNEPAFYNVKYNPYNDNKDEDVNIKHCL